MSVAVDGARDKRTAVLSYNVRGVGLSMGKQPWHGLGIRMEAEDFAAVERWGLESLAPKELVRFASLLFLEIYSINMLMEGMGSHRVALGAR